LAEAGNGRVNSSPVRESLYTLIELMGGRKSWFARKNCLNISGKSFAVTVPADNF